MEKFVRLEEELYNLKIRQGNSDDDTSEEEKTGHSFLKNESREYYLPKPCLEYKQVRVCKKLFLSTLGYTNDSVITELSHAIKKTNVGEAIGENRATETIDNFDKCERQGRPDQVHNCTILNISMTSFQIRCTEGFNGGLTQAFLLEIKESQSQELKDNITSPIAKFSVNNLEPGAQYQAVLFAYNSKGRSEPTILQAATLRLPEKQLTAERDTHKSAFRFTPLMSVIIGVVSALLIVALVVILVLRLQCTQGGDHRRKQQRHKNAVVSGGSLEHRGSGSGATLSDKGGGSPVSKHESSAGECDSDEKNPDIIPQPVDTDDGSDYSRKKQHISTIETSPSRSLLHQAGNSGYMGYCTLRNGMPLHELNAQSKMLPGPAQMIPTYNTSCTLPRQPPQQWQYGPVSHLPPGVYPVQYRGGPVAQQRIRSTQTREPPIPLQPIISTEEEPSPETPLMANKRESTV